MLPFDRLVLNISVDSTFFVSSGIALAAGGPGSLLIAEILVTTVTYCAMESLSEINLFIPSASFITATHRFIDPAWSFAVGWIYVIHSLLVIPFALASAARLLSVYLLPWDITTWVGILLIPVLAILLIKTKTLAQLAANIALAKVLGLLGFM